MTSWKLSSDAVTSLIWVTKSNFSNCNKTWKLLYFLWSILWTGRFLLRHYVSMYGKPCLCPWVLITPKKTRSYLFLLAEPHWDLRQAFRLYFSGAAGLHLRAGSKCCRKHWSRIVCQDQPLAISRSVMTLPSSNASRLAQTLAYVGPCPHFSSSPD